MKLYATITSERATKGQGGEYLDIGIQNEFKEVVATINVREIEGAKGYDTRRTIKIWYNGLTEVLSYKNSAEKETIKGEKQKGETGKCNLCSRAASRKATNLSEAWEYCEKHYQELKNLQ